MSTLRKIACIAAGMIFAFAVPVQGGVENFSALTPMTALTGAEVIPGQQGGVTLRTSPAALAALISSSALVPTSGDTSGAIDTPLLQAALNVICSDTTGNYRYLFLHGVYYTNAKLICTTNATLQGEGPIHILGVGQTSIIQETTNTGILEFQEPQFCGGSSQCTPNGFSVENLNLNYATQQTSSNTASVALGFRSASGTTAGTMFQIYLDRLYIHNAFRGIANTQVSGAFPIWGIKISRSYIQSNAGAAIWLVSPVSTGQPNISLDHLYLTSYAGGSESLIRVDATDSLKISNVECNQLTNEPMYNITSAWFEIDVSKLETATYSVNTNPVIVLQNSIGSINNFSLSNVALTAANLNLISDSPNNANQSITVRGLTVSVASGTGSLNLYNMGSGKIIQLDTNNITSVGPGPATVRLVNSGGSTNSNLLEIPTSPGGSMSDDQGDASVTLAPLTTPKTVVFNTALSTARTFNASAANGSSVADNLWDGATWRIVCTATCAGGAGSLTITNLAGSASKVVGAGWVDIAYRRSYAGMVEVASGSL